MALIGNQSVLNKSLAVFRHGTATAGAFAGNNRTNRVKLNRSKFFTANEKSSYPEGYNIGGAIFPALVPGALASTTRIGGEGGISAVALRVKLSEDVMEGVGAISSASLAVILPASSALSGSGSITATALAVSGVSAAVSGSGSITAALKVTVPVASSLAGSCSLTPALTGTGRLEAEITPYTELSPENLATAVWATDPTGADAGTVADELLRARKAAENAFAVSS